MTNKPQKPHWNAATLDTEQVEMLRRARFSPVEPKALCRGCFEADLEYLIGHDLLTVDEYTHAVSIAAEGRTALEFYAGVTA